SNAVKSRSAGSVMLVVSETDTVDVRSSKVIVSTALISGLLSISCWPMAALSSTRPSTASRTARSADDCWVGSGAGPGAGCGCGAGAGAGTGDSWGDAETPALVTAVNVYTPGSASVATAAMLSRPTRAKQSISPSRFCDGGSVQVMS